MELLAPAGNIEKLSYAYAYGADAAYIGMRNFSLRAKADNFDGEDYREIREIKGDRKLYGALNIAFHEDDLKVLEENLEYLSLYPFDAFIVSDLGIVRLLSDKFPSTALHLSTQANCVNSEAVKLYRDLGFRRIILGREVGLAEIGAIRVKVPDVELEVFVHGAMCLAYSGRCFLSAYLAGRSGNKGHCAHSCRWNYRVLEEGQRPGEYFPVIEDGRFSTILSSKDLCMIDHLGEFADAGVDSLKIEGRMKSAYYTAVVTRAYRKHLDVLEGKRVDHLEEYREDLFKVSHREFSTGFYFDRDDIEKPTELEYLREHVFLGAVGRQIAPSRYLLSVKNQIRAGETIEYIGPDIPSLTDTGFVLLDRELNPVEKADHGKVYVLETGLPVKEGYLVRKTAVT